MADVKRPEPKQFFLGAKRSFGEMDGDVKGEKIKWDNVIVYRAQEILDKDSGNGYEKMDPCKIKTEEFQEVTGEPWEKFKDKIPDRFMKQIIVFFGEMRGAKDDRKADTKYFRFVGEKTA